MINQVILNYEVDLIMVLYLLYFLQLLNPFNPLSILLNISFRKNKNGSFRFIAKTQEKETSTMIGPINTETNKVRSVNFYQIIKNTCCIQS